MKTLNVMVKIIISSPLSTFSSFHFQRIFHLSIFRLTLTFKKEKKKKSENGPTTRESKTKQVIVHSLDLYI